MPIVIGAAGIVTPIIEAAATAIGSGVIVGGFGGATAGVLNGRTRKQVEGNAMRDSYIGAAAVLGIWIFDQCIVYATSI